MNNYRDEYDADGRVIARTYANDPANPRSWRKASAKFAI